MTRAAQGRYERGVLVESPQHVQAKKRLARWLAAAANGDDGAPRYRVALEYPFAATGEGVQCWSTLGFARKPTRAQLRAQGLPAAYICDIVLLERSVVTVAVEVVKGNWTTTEKADWLKAHGIVVYEAHVNSILPLRAAPETLDAIMVRI